jgi:hypothetical protein
MSLATHSASAEIGRLFFTPQKRAALDHARKHQLTEKDVDTPKHIRIDGILHGPHGATVWVNDTPVKDRSTTAGITVKASENPDQVQITPVGKAASRVLKVGETHRARLAP